MKKLISAILSAVIFITIIPSDVFALRPMAYRSGIQTEVFNKVDVNSVTSKQGLLLEALNKALNSPDLNDLLDLVKDFNKVRDIDLTAQLIAEVITSGKISAEQAGRSLAKLSVSDSCFEKTGMGISVAEACCILAERLAGDFISAYVEDIDYYENTHFVRRLVRHEDPYYDLTGKLGSLSMAFDIENRAPSQPKLKKFFSTVYSKVSEYLKSPIYTGVQDIDLLKIKSDIEAALKDLENDKDFYDPKIYPVILERIKDTIAVLDDLCAFVNGDAGRVEEIDIAEIIRQIYGGVSEDGVIKLFGPVKFQANKRRLSSVLYTIRKNAQDSGAENIKARLSLEDNKWLVVRLNDDGPGITDSTHLKQGRYPGRPMFFDLGWSTKSKSGGTGTYELWKVVSEHGGFIRIDSLTESSLEETPRHYNERDNDRGTTLTIYLPIEELPLGDVPMKASSSGDIKGLFAKDIENTLLRVLNLKTGRQLSSDNITIKNEPRFCPIPFRQDFLLSVREKPSQSLIAMVKYSVVPQERSIFSEPYIIIRYMTTSNQLRKYGIMKLLLAYITKVYSVGFIFADNPLLDDGAHFIRNLKDNNFLTEANIPFILTGGKVNKDMASQVLGHPASTIDRSSSSGEGRRQNSPINLGRRKQNNIEQVQQLDRYGYVYLSLWNGMYFIEKAVFGPLAADHDNELERLDKLADVANTPKVAATFIDDDGTERMLLSYSKGYTLKEIMDTNKPRVKSLMQAGFFKKLKDIVGQAHDRGVAHHDLHSQNIIVPEDNEPFIIDWDIQTYLPEFFDGAKELDMIEINAMERQCKEIVSDSAGSGDIPNPAVIEFIKDISRFLYEAVSVLQEYKDSGAITHYYITGSFARGDMKPTPKDIDFVVNPSQSFISSGNVGIAEDITRRINEIGRQAGTDFNVTYAPFGSVYKIDDDISVLPTGQIRGKDIMDNMSGSVEKILIDLTGRNNLYSAYNNDFFIRLFQNLYAIRQEREASKASSAGSSQDKILSAYDVILREKGSDYQPTLAELSERTGLAQGTLKRHILSINRDRETLYQDPLAYRDITHKPHAGTANVKNSAIVRRPALPVDHSKILVNAVLSDTGNIENLSVNGIHGVFIDKPLFAVGEYEAITNPIYYKLYCTINDIPFRKIRPHVNDFTVKVLNQGDTEPWLISLPNRATMVMQEMLLNSVHISDGSLGRKMIVACRLDETGDNVHIFSIDTGKGIDDIPKSVETTFSELDEKWRDLHGIGNGVGLSRVMLDSLCMFEGGSFTVDSNGKRFQYTYNVEKKVIERRQLESIIDARIGTYMELKLVVPKVPGTIARIKNHIIVDIDDRQTMFGGRTEKSSSGGYASVLFRKDPIAKKLQQPTSSPDAGRVSIVSVMPRPLSRQLRKIKVLVESAA
jgi:signal transduction histidine kinase/serine/threonine protein kinase